MQDLCLCIEVMYRYVLLTSAMCIDLQVSDPQEHASFACFLNTIFILHLST